MGCCGLLFHSQIFPEGPQRKGGFHSEEVPAQVMLDCLGAGLKGFPMLARFYSCACKCWFGELDLRLCRAIAIMSHLMPLL